MQAAIETIDLLKLASGDILCLQIYKFQGEQPGKKVYIQSNLHGAEIIGNAVIYQLIEFLTNLDRSQIRGEICLLPGCNPLATNQRQHFFSTGRFNSYDGRDWNRIFWDYSPEDLSLFAQSCLDLELETIREKYLLKQKEALREQVELIKSPKSSPYYQSYRYLLQSLCLDANYVIDIHSSSNQSLDYLYCFASREKSASYFLLDYGILMHQYDGQSFDEAFLKPWLDLESELLKLGRKVQFDLESWTLELGNGMTIAPESLKKGVQGIKNYLAFQGILLTDIEVKDKPIRFFEKDKISRYYAPTGGMIVERAPLGTYVKQGEIIYKIISFQKNREMANLVEITAENSGLLFDTSTNQAVNQGEYVLTILEVD